MDKLLNALTLISLLMMGIVLFSVRRSHIRVEYSVSWLGAATVLLILSRSHSTLNWIASYLGLTYPPMALIILIFFVFLVVFYRFSMIISGLKDANIAMAQRLAILEFRLQSQNESQ